MNEKQSKMQNKSDGVCKKLLFNFRTWGTTATFQGGTTACTRLRVSILPVWSSKPSSAILWPMCPSYYGKCVYAVCTFTCMCTYGHTDQWYHGSTASTVVELKTRARRTMVPRGGITCPPRSTIGMRLQPSNICGMRC